TVPRFSDGDFRHHFRIDRTTFEIILQHLAPHLLLQTPQGKEQFATGKQLLLFLWYISNQESMRETAHLFGISNSTVHSTLIKIIQWPNPARQNDIAASFQLSCGLPNINRIIDGTHIRLSAPVGGDPDYISRKGFPSFVLQVIVDDNLLITSAHTEWPGCSHDTRILRNSGIFAKAEVGQLIPHHKHITEHICLFMMAACKLHNLCIIHEDSIEEFVDFNPAHILHPNQYQNVYPNAANGVARRNHLMNILP
ncbi:hypothetical protein KUTeg_001217, partial [Tegillarca granosa]